MKRVIEFFHAPIGDLAMSCKSPVVPAVARPRRRAGFTLVEVVIGLLILVVACLTVLMLLPKALQLQQESRLKMLAAMHAQGLIANFIGHEQDLQREVTSMTPVSGRLYPNAEDKNWAQWSWRDITPFPTPEKMHRDSRWLQAKGEFDLERVTTQIHRGNYPVPLEIAQRLESPGNEIQSILANGGQVYYSDLNGGEENVGKGAPLTRDSTEFRKLIWGVVGPPQQNILPFNPVAYQQVEMYPHPPQAWSRPLDRVWKIEKVSGVEFVRSEVLPANAQYNGVTFPNGVTILYWRQGGSRTRMNPIVTGLSNGWEGYNNVSSYMDYGIPCTTDRQYGTWLTPFAYGKNTAEASGMGLYERNTWEWYAKIAFDAQDSANDGQWFDERWKSDASFRNQYKEFVADASTRNRVFERLHTSSATFSYFTTLDAFRVLANQHWSRIMGQIDEVTNSYSDVTLSSAMPSVVVGSSGRYIAGTPRQVAALVYATDAEGRVIRDSMGNIVYKEGTKWETPMIWVADPPGGGAATTLPPSMSVMLSDQMTGDSGITQYYDLNSSRTWDKADVNPNFWYGVPTGYSQPAQGVGFSRLRGSDILHEDAVLVGPSSMAREVYQSMPSLERRVKYRTAALILWAKAAYGIDIRHIEDPTLAYVESETGTKPTVPTGSGRSYLPKENNPLYSWQNLSGFLEVRQENNELKKGVPVRDMSKWHPTQILALNYLAHAAVMCTGYRPPFYRDNNTPELNDDELLVEDEDRTVAGNNANDSAKMKRYRMLRRFGVRHDQLPYKAVDAGAMEEGIFSATNAYWKLYPALGLARDNSVSSADWRVRAFVSTSPFATATVNEINVDPLSGTLQLAANEYLVMEDSNGDGKFDGKGELYAEYNSDGTMDRKKSNPVVYNRSRNYYLRNPYVLELMPNTQDIQHAVFSFPLETAQPQVLQTYAKPVYDPSTLRQRDNVPIGYRPKCEEILNPFPPPYADTGAFDAGGNRRYKVSWQVMMERSLASPNTQGDRFVPRLMRTVDKGNVDGKDTAWARNAHEAMLRILMRYKACNPYDNTVPLPANRQIFTDRGIWQKDIFAGYGEKDGTAYRPASITNVVARQNAYYPLTCPIDENRGDKMRWSMAFASPHNFQPKGPPYSSKGPYNEPVEWRYRWTDGYNPEGQQGLGEGTICRKVGMSGLANRYASIRAGEGSLFGWLDMEDPAVFGFTDSWSNTAQNYGPMRQYQQGAWWSLDSQEPLNLYDRGGRMYLYNGSAFVGFYAGNYQQSKVVTASIKSVMQSPRVRGLEYNIATNTIHRPITGDSYWDQSDQYRSVYTFQSLRYVLVPARSSDLTTIMHKPSNCNAVSKFEPSARCRQLVYWVADWMQYEDFESAPSAPIDWSQMPSYAYGGFSANMVKFCAAGTNERFSATAARFRDVTKDGDWRAVIWLQTNTYTGGDQLTLMLNGKPEPVTIVESADDGSGSPGLYYPYWVKPRKMDPTNPDRDFSESIFYDTSKLLINCGGKGVYNDWATTNKWDPVGATVSATDAQLTQWKDPDGLMKWSDYNVTNTTVGLWNPGTPTKTGEGGPPEYRFIFTSPYRLCTLSSSNRALLHTIDANVKIGSIAGEAGFGKIYSFASPKGTICRGVPAEPFLTIQNQSLKGNESLTMDAIGYNPFLMTGCFGADRNHDGVFSKGSIRKTERMRAEPIARFNYYDPIAWICVGQ